MTDDIVVSIRPVERAARKALIAQRKRERQSRNHVVSPRTGRLMVDTRVIVPTARRGIAPQGSYQHGDTYNLSGSGFGPDATPVIYDDSEAGTIGDEVDIANPLWRIDVDNNPNPTNTGPIHSAEDVYFGSSSIKLDHSTGGNVGMSIGSLATQEFYLSFQWKFNVLTYGTTQKGVRAHADDGPNVYTSSPGWFTQDWHRADGSARSPRITVNADDSGDGINGAPYYSTTFPESSWFRLESYWKQSDAGAANGVMRKWIDLTQEQNVENVITRDSGVTDLFERVMMPFDYTNGSTAIQYFDEIYLSKTQARVEIGNASTWAACTERAIQNPSSWSDSSITFTVNRAGLSIGTNYIYTVDSSGNATQQGTIEIA